jgi:hypothetical protein
MLSQAEISGRSNTFREINCDVGQCIDWQSNKSRKYQIFFCSLSD